MPFLKPSLPKNSGFQFVIFLIFLLDAKSLSTSLFFGLNLCLSVITFILVPSCFCTSLTTSETEISKFEPIFIISPIALSLSLIAINPLATSVT